MFNQILVWVVFNLFVVAMLALDLGVFHRQAHEIRIREALLWSAFWIGLSLLFNLLRRLYLLMHHKLERVLRVI